MSEDFDDLCFKLWPWFVGLILFFVALLLGWVFLHLIGEELWPKRCAEFKTVEEIGACGRYGTCSVRFTDGSIGRIYLPMEGEEVCTGYDYWPYQK